MMPLKPDLPSLAPRSRSLSSFLLPPRTGLHHHCPGLVPSCRPPHCCQSHCFLKCSWVPLCPCFKSHRCSPCFQEKATQGWLGSGPTCLASLNSCSPPSLFDGTTSQLLLLPGLAQARSSLGSLNLESPFLTSTPSS